MNNIFAFTEVNHEQPSYPGFISINGDESGNVVVTIRESPTVRDSVYICSHESGPGKCTAGGPTCNNYCNMAPQKGPMQDRPLPCQQVLEGKQATFTIPKSHWTLKP